MMSIDWKTEPATAFPNISTQWDELNQRNSNQAVMSASFIASALRHFSSGNEQLVQGWMADKLVFAGVFARQSTFRWSIFQPSQAPLGVVLSDQGNLDNALLNAVARCLPGKPLMIDLTQLDSDLYDQSPDDSLLVLPYINTGSLALPEDFDSYFSSLSKNSRQNVNKSKNRLGKEDVSVKLEIIKDKSKIEDLVTQYGQLESKGWKSALGTAVHQDNVQGQFYIDMLSTFAETGDAQVWCYFFNDQIIAVDLCIVLGNTLTILKTTFDEDYARYSPSLLMKLDAYRILSQEGAVRRIEYFGKVMDWHRRLQCQERPIFHATWCKYPGAYRLANKLKSFVNKAK